MYIFVFVKNYLSWINESSDKFPDNEVYTNSFIPRGSKYYLSGSLREDCQVGMGSVGSQGSIIVQQQAESLPTCNRDITFSEEML